MSVFKTSLKKKDLEEGKLLKVDINGWVTDLKSYPVIVDDVSGEVSIDAG